MLAEAETKIQMSPVQPLGSIGQKGLAEADSRDIVFSFGNFMLQPAARSLMRDGNPVEIGSRAFDLLVRLVQSHGQMVSKVKIIDHVWPGIFVDECNLRFQITQLRKALGDQGQLIKTIPGRGYLLAATDSQSGLVTNGLKSNKLGGSPKISRSNGQTSKVLSNEEFANPNGRRPQLVIVDPDDEATRLVGLLEHYAMDVRHFHTAEAFIEARVENNIDCVILDVWLPGSSGLDLQADFMRQGYLIPFIFISSHADVDAAVRAMKAGAAEFLTKPVRHLDLLEAVQNVVGLAGPSSEASA